MVEYNLENHNQLYGGPNTTEQMYETFDNYLHYVPTIDAPWPYVYQFMFIMDNHTVWENPQIVQFLYAFVTARGEYLYSPATKYIVDQWVQNLTNPHDFIIPSGGFPSWGSFFTRKLVDGARKVDEPDSFAIITSPADSTMLYSFENIQLGTQMQLKGQSVDIFTLLGGNPRYKQFLGGQGMAVTLGPYDYHRIHTPVRGRVVESDLIGGMYYGYIINPIEFMYKFRRGVIFIDTESPLGTVALVPIGVLEVGSVTLHCEVGQFYEKGAEIGNFDLGGSAIAILFEPHVDLELVQQIGERVLVGQAVMKISKLKDEL
jgi:phosphatidylserine decarboxylase